MDCFLFGGAYPVLAREAIMRGYYRPVSLGAVCQVFLVVTSFFLTGDGAGDKKQTINY